jgi:hypothetical protein
VIAPSKPSRLDGLGLARYDASVPVTFQRQPVLHGDDTTIKSEHVVHEVADVPDAILEQAAHASRPVGEEPGWVRRGRNAIIA